jgi:Uma2 family endonuclease
VLRLTVEQVHRMLAAGILVDGEPVELIDGILVRKDRGPEGNPMVISSAHALAATRLGQLDRLVEPLGYHLRVQQPVTLSPTSEPEPDASVARGTATDYATRHPGPGDLAAVIEVAESSLSYDRTTKLRLYARAGIPAYWVVNLPERQIEVFGGPAEHEQHYTTSLIAKRGESIRLELGTGSVDVAVSSILPPDA